jgi:hypothetical protein
MSSAVLLRRQGIKAICNQTLDAILVGLSTRPSTFSVDNFNRWGHHAVRFWHLFFTEF